MIPSLPKELLDQAASPREAGHFFSAWFTAYRQERGNPPDLKHPSGSKILSLFGNSAWLSQFLGNHPLLYDSLGSSPFLTKRKGLEDHREDLRQVPKGDSPKGVPPKGDSPTGDFHSNLLLYKNSELLRIALRSLEIGSSEEEIGHELSDLAQAIVEKAHQVLGAIHQRELGLRKIPLCCLGLGKLGGQDLNFSSDIDLLYLYGDDEERGSELSTHEYFVKRVERERHFLSDKTDSFLYRVDLDLRPEGKKGTLVNSLPALEEYYETWGAEWERIALIKGRCLAGDKPLAEKFIKMAHPFVWRKSFEDSALNQIKTIKEKSDALLRKKVVPTFHVKLGSGGIREVELFVWIFQLIFGGRHPQLQEAHTLQALRQLKALSLIPARETKQLEKAYLFLRRIENRLQMQENQQIHQIPESAEGQEALARLLGYPQETRKAARKAFLEDLEQTRTYVQKHFASLFERGPKKQRSWKEEQTLRLQSELEPLPTVEEKFDSLRLFKKEVTGEIIQEDQSGKLSFTNFLVRNTELAEVILQEAYQIALAEMAARYGPLKGEGLAIIGMGKLGGRELTYRSDLDLQFLYDENSYNKTLSLQEYFAKLAQRVLSCLTIITEQGWAYKIDTALRPSGSAGVLVGSLASFLEYHEKESKTWEKQALLKARPVAGDPFLCDKAAVFLKGIPFRFPPSPSLLQDIASLRTRMEREIARETESSWNLKTGYGGIVDIEFLTQGLQLLHGRDFSELAEPNTLLALEKLSGLQFLTPQETNDLKEGYQFLRRLETALRLQLESPTDCLELTAPWLPTMATALNFSSATALVDAARSWRKKIRGLYEGVFGSRG
ncbi:MAG: hypothetical protein HYS22_02905 [Deltaproteobacteria bacterium]|nr:hypothetical protein [Deltaproteobacteria bacterium]